MREPPIALRASRKIALLAASRHDVDFTRRALRRLRSRLLWIRDSRSVALSVAEARLNGEIGHAEAAESLREFSKTSLTAHLPWISDVAIAQLMQCCGLFEASSEIFPGIQQFDLRPPSDRASHRWFSFLRRSLPAGKGSIEDAMKIIDAQIGLDLSHHPVVLVGPGTHVVRPPDDFPTEFLVARVIAPGLTEWEPSADLYRGRLDLAYSNTRTTEWLRSQSTFRSYRLGTRILYDSVRSAPPLAVRDSEALVSPRRLFRSGLPNMAQQAIFDLLSRAAPRVFVTGVDFHTTQRSYRETDQRTHWSMRRDHMGRSGSTLERCHSLALLDANYNRDFSAWLDTVSPHLEFDSRARQVLAMSTQEYLARLDVLYGAPMM